MLCWIVNKSEEDPDRKLLFTGSLDELKKWWHQPTLVSYDSPCDQRAASGTAPLVAAGYGPPCLLIAKKRRPGQEKLQRVLGNLVQGCLFERGCWLLWDLDPTVAGLHITTPLNQGLVRCGGSDLRVPGYLEDATVLSLLCCVQRAA